MSLARKAGALLALAPLVALALTTPVAHAAPTSPGIDIHEEDQCGQLTLTTSWEAISRPVDNTTLIVLAAGQLHTAPIGEAVTVGPFDQATVTVHYRIAGGAERDYDSPAWTISRPDLLDYIDAHGADWQFSADPPWFVGWHETTVAGCVTEPSVEFVDTCDGVKVHLANGQQATAEVSFTINDGEPVGPLQPGMTPEPLLLPAAAVVVAAIEVDLVWEHQWSAPAGCPSASPPPDAGKGGIDPVANQLPATGSPVLPLATAVGGILLLTGIALLAGLRRRRVDRL